MQDVDVVVVGSGPNGLAAAIVLARAGLQVRVVEAHEEVGGGTRTKELTLPGFKHDVCSSVHTMGWLSPLFRALPLSEHGLRWVHPTYSAAHPLDDQPSVLLARSFDVTCERLGPDARAWRNMFSPFVRDPDTMFGDLLAPLRIPRAPLTFLRFGLKAFRSARGLAFSAFEGERARALFAGNAAHSILPLEWLFTAAVGLVFGVAGHVSDWPVAEGGSHAITKALASYARSLGVEIVTNTRVVDMRELGSARAFMFDTAPKQLAEIGKDLLPASYRKRLFRYVYGPGVFKVDWALSGPIPWKDPETAKASVVHVAGTFDELAAAESAVWRNEHPERPFVMLSQQSHIDPTRAPAGKHTGHAYCHVPNGSSVDMTKRIEDQIERFAPGFRDLILARHTMNTSAFETMNPACVGGAVTGGAAHLPQLFTRPVARLNPYSTPHPKLFICSGSSPPGGGVHGMGGYWAARSVLKRLGVPLPSF